MGRLNRYEYVVIRKSAKCLSQMERHQVGAKFRDNYIKISLAYADKWGFDTLKTFLSTYQKLKCTK